MGLLLQQAMKRPLLQVALDFTDINMAVNIASKVFNADVDVIEIGTPLIKSFGLHALREIKKIVKEKIVLADLKTADAIALEFNPYASEGAHAVTILGIVDDDVIKDAVEMCRNLGIDLVVDLIYVQNPVDRALRLASCGVNIVNLHIGVDVQRKRGVSAKQLLREVEEISQSDVIVSVAGGIKHSDIELFLQSGAKIIVMGSAITRSSDPYEAAKKAVEIIKRKQLV
ncbi:orotidine 5'-phosphate decarboxylase [Ignisphaera sp. 4213-co]|uniref:Orotidine 5'-phosphate decarboxylase n=1 Tax=Ignisphaera cupida TaxID=3050454 RepID=A0ABD4Z6Z9_9CREN|nr:orotidine 5'-phosphate decarboxylase / HUMPS family protein [Ignisphaera sp. 4213-co]MDK6029091.1 orotidine 5'-phosphate decarboxylase [Ignisphaera sp. 4213-co]